MKKKIIVCLLCGMVVLGYAGCGASGLSAGFDSKAYGNCKVIAAKAMENFDDKYNVLAEFLNSSYCFSENDVENAYTAFQYDTRYGTINLSIRNSDGEYLVLICNSNDSNTNYLRNAFDFWVKEMGLSPDKTFDEMFAEDSSYDYMGYHYSLLSSSLFISKIL